MDLFIHLGTITLSHSYSFLYSKFSHLVNLYFQTLTQIVMCFVSLFKIYKSTHCRLKPTVKQTATRTQKQQRRIWNSQNKDSSLVRYIANWPNVTWIKAFTNRVTWQATLVKRHAY